MIKLSDFSIRADKKLGFSRADVFEWLAVVEAISYQDFNFFTIANDLIAAVVEDLSSPQELVFSLPHAAKRLLVIPSLSCLSSVQAGDIACVRMACRAEGCSCLMELEQLLESLSALRINVCLSWRCCSRDISEVVGQSSTLQHIEWVWRGEHADDTAYAGLILSPSWRPGVSEHIAKTIANYNHTLAPDPRGLARFAGARV